jgi:23S rRNA (uracil1939-C5)-methyltransferase
VWGIESHGGAIALARRNAERNGLLERCTFVAGDVAEALEQGLLQEPAAVLLDPPRKGLEEGVVASLLRQRPPLVAYLSCDPATLARDLGRLTGEGGFRVNRVQPLDFFPNTSHVEVLALLDRV